MENTREKPQTFSKTAKGDKPINENALMTQLESSTSKKNATARSRAAILGS